MAVAVVVVLLLAIVVPSYYHERTTAAQAPIDERYLADLRILPYAQSIPSENTEYRCTIFHTERVMESTHKPASQQHSDLRAAARARARAKARIAQRQAIAMRTVTGAAVLAAITVILWVLVGSIHLPLSVGVVVTLVFAAYLGGFGYLAVQWKAANELDRARMKEAHAELARRSTPRASAAVRTSPARKSSGRSSLSRSADSAQASASPAADQYSELGAASAQNAQRRTDSPALRSSEHESAHPQEARSTVPSVHSSSTAQGTRVNSLKRSSTAVGSAVRGEGNAARIQEPSLPSSQARLSDTPSYTLKPTTEQRRAPISALGRVAETPIVKRRVKPYEAPDDGMDAAVPYRPVRLGERLAEGSLGAANEAPVMTGAEELRSDLLGGGATLDALLDRRRA